jgi:hypothetical protein
LVAALTYPCVNCQSHVAGDGPIEQCLAFRAWRQMFGALARFGRSFRESNFE